MYGCGDLRVCMCVCVRVCMCVYIHTYICVYIYIHTYTHTYIHTYIYTHIHTHIHTYIHTYIPMRNICTAAPRTGLSTDKYTNKHTQPVAHQILPHHKRIINKEIHQKKKEMHKKTHATCRSSNTAAPQTYPPAPHPHDYSQ